LDHHRKVNGAWGGGLTLAASHGATTRRRAYNQYQREFTKKKHPTGAPAKGKSKEMSQKKKWVASGATRSKNCQKKGGCSCNRPNRQRKRDRERWTGKGRKAVPERIFAHGLPIFAVRMGILPGRVDYPVGWGGRKANVQRAVQPRIVMRNWDRRGGDSARERTWWGTGAQRGSRGEKPTGGEVRRAMQKKKWISTGKGGKGRTAFRGEKTGGGRKWKRDHRQEET